MAPNLTPEEFKKLWNEKKIDTVGKNYLNGTSTDHDPSEEKNTDSEHSKTVSIDELKISQSSLIAELEKSIIEINSNRRNNLNQHTRRGVEQNSSEQIVRVIRMPLSKDMEDQLIKIRRLLNQLHQVKKPREVIDDYQVLLALLHWASKQLNTAEQNSLEIEKSNLENKQLKDT